MDKLIFLFHRKDGLTREEFAEHYLDVHAPLGLRVTVTMDGYTVNLVDSDDDGAHDAITEVWTASSADFFDPAKSFATPEDAKQLMTDHDSFIGPFDTYLVEERVVRGDAEVPDGVKRVSCYLEGDTVPEPGPGVTDVLEHRVVQVAQPRRARVRDHRVDVGPDGRRPRSVDRESPTTCASTARSCPSPDRSDDARGRELGVGGGQLLQQVAQLALLGGGQRRERRRRFRQQLEGVLAARAALLGQHDGPDPPIGGVGAPLGEPALLEAVGEVGDPRRVAAPVFGEVAHAHAGAVGVGAEVHERLEQGRGQAQLGAHPVHAVVRLTLHEEGVHRRPCVAGRLRAHDDSVTETFDEDLPLSALKT